MRAKSDVVHPLSASNIYTISNDSVCNVDTGVLSPYQSSTMLSSC